MPEEKEVPAQQRFDEDYSAAEMNMLATEPLSVFNADEVDNRTLKKVVNILIKQGADFTAIPARHSADKEEEYRERFKSEGNDQDQDISEDVNRAYAKATNHVRVEDAAAATNSENRSNCKRLMTLFNPNKKKGGKGDLTDEGFYDDQINTIMSRFQDFKGCIMRNEIKKLLPDVQPQSRIAFIINTDTSEKPGSHWQAVYIDARNGADPWNSMTHLGPQ